MLLASIRDRNPVIFLEPKRLYRTSTWYGPALALRRCGRPLFDTPQPRSYRSTRLCGSAAVIKQRSCLQLAGLIHRIVFQPPPPLLILPVCTPPPRPPRPPRPRRVCARTPVCTRSEVPVGDYELPLSTAEVVQAGTDITVLGPPDCRVCSRCLPLCFRCISFVFSLHCRCLS